MVALYIGSLLTLGVEAIFFRLVGLSFFILMTIASIILRLRIGRVGTVFLTGWLLTFGLNFLYAFASIPTFVIDFTGLLAKFIFAYGVIQPRFAFAQWISEIRASPSYTKGK